MTREEKNKYILENTIVDTTYPTSEKFHDISGSKFNHLTAVRYIGKAKNNGIYYEFECDCNERNKIIASYSNVLSGSTISCGCVNRKNRLESITKHGLSRSPLYKIYYHIRYRCYNPNKDNYINYGGRGIYVCDEWMDTENGFINFYNWSIENGYHKGASIDRIDNDGPYAPWNCRWVSSKVQNNNRRSNHLLTYKNYRYTISEWADICKLTSDAILGRLKNGWDIERILFTPLNNLEKVHLFVIPPEYLEFNKYKEA